MSRLLSRLSALVLLFPCLAAYAAAAADAPAEQASPMVVIGFLVLLVGACVGYGLYLVRSHKDKSPKSE